MHDTLNSFIQDAPAICGGPEVERAGPCLRCDGSVCVRGPASGGRTLVRQQLGESRPMTSPQRPTEW